MYKKCGTRDTRRLNTAIEIRKVRVNSLMPEGYFAAGMDAYLFELYATSIYIKRYKKSIGRRGETSVPNKK